VREQGRGRGERGQVIVLFALMLVPLLVMAALVVDIGVHQNEHQDVRDAVDAASLAATAYLPTLTASDGTNAIQIAKDYATGNDSGLDADDLMVTFHCLVADANNNGQADIGTVPGHCNPGAIASWDCSGGRCIADCVPSDATKCNVVRVSISKDVPYGFARVIGQDHGNTGVVDSAACTGPCGGAPNAPLDIVLILDRTYSLHDEVSPGVTEFELVQAAARSFLLSLDPNLQHVALGVLGPSDAVDNDSPYPCTGYPTAYGHLAENYTTTDNDPAYKWIVAPPGPAWGPLQSDYQLNGVLNPSSQIVRTIDCLEMNGVTDLSTPIEKAKQYLDSPWPRPPSEAERAIVLFTDGEATGPTGTPYQPCNRANTKATAAKNGAVPIKIVTIGFALNGLTCRGLLPYGGADEATSSPYHGVSAMQLLEDMSSPVPGTPATNAECNSAENADGDLYFCEPDATDLSSVFVQAAAQLTGKPRLVRLP
jgi:hypothetical protein